MRSFEQREIEVGAKILPWSEKIHLRAKGVWEYLGISRSSFYAMQNPGCIQYDKTFPAPYQIAKRVKVWSLAEIAEWVSKREVVRPEGGVQ